MNRRSLSRVVFYLWCAARESGEDIFVSVLLLCV